MVQMSKAFSSNRCVIHCWPKWYVSYGPELGIRSFEHFWCVLLPACWTYDWAAPAAIIGAYFVLIWIDKIQAGAWETGLSNSSELGHLRRRKRRSWYSNCMLRCPDPFLLIKAMYVANTAWLGSRKWWYLYTCREREAQNNPWRNRAVYTVPINPSVVFQPMARQLGLSGNRGEGKMGTRGCLLNIVCTQYRW
jgi:hypothetical protein